MEDLVARGIDFLSDHKGWAGPVLGLLAFGESLAVVGLLIPATAALIAVGSLIATGTVDGPYVVICLLIGSILGDWVSYALGRWVGPTAYRRWPLKNHRGAVAQARLFFRRWGFVAVLLGRFLGPLRSTVPLIAGVLRMPFGAFQLANVLSALIWVPLMLAPGYLAAKQMIAMGGFSETHLALSGLAIGILIAALSWLFAMLFGRKRGDRRPGRRLRSADAGGRS